MAMLGLRHGELLALQWSDFADDFSTVRVRRSLTRSRGPGEERDKQTHRIPRFKDPKTEAESRTIPLPPQIAIALKKWKLASPFKAGHDLVFPDELGRPMHVSRALKELHRIQEAAGLRWLDVKALRHSFATALMEGGEVDTQVARLLGHADTTVTRKVYTHAYEKTDVRGVRVLADAVFGAVVARVSEREVQNVQAEQHGDRAPAGMLESAPSGAERNKSSVAD
jgi:integrase